MLMISWLGEWRVLSLVPMWMSKEDVADCLVMSFIFVDKIQMCWVGRSTKEDVEVELRAVSTLKSRDYLLENIRYYGEKQRKDWWRFLQTHYHLASKANPWTKLSSRSDFWGIPNEFCHTPKLEVILLCPWRKLKNFRKPKKIKKILFYEYKYKCSCNKFSE